MEQNTRLSNIALAKRCRAHSKRSGNQCKSPAVKGWNVCRMHGAGGGAPKGNRNAWKHGRYSAAAIQERRELRAAVSAIRELIAEGYLGG